MKTILVTGAAGFIGLHVMKALIDEDIIVIGIDSINDYYSQQLKIDRLRHLGFAQVDQWNVICKNESHSNALFYRTEIADAEAVKKIFDTHKIDAVINLAAQAGVRYSLTHPEKYIQANVVGYFNLLDQAKKNNIDHFVYASSSSVYGLNKKMPLAVGDNVDHPISLYAATKKSNELFAHSYSHLYGLPTTGLRFFTVYGPWGRPDMAYYKFTNAILNGETINVYNHGDMYRDFTYVDDIVTGILRVVSHIPKENLSWNGMQPDPSFSLAPYRIFNIGNHKPIKLLDFIHTLECSLKLKAKINFMEMQPGDVYKTFADVEHLKSEVDYKPQTNLEQGVEKFVEWYRGYYK